MTGREEEREGRRAGWGEPKTESHGVVMQAHRRANPNS